MTTPLVRLTTALLAVATAAGLAVVPPAAAGPDDGAVTSVRLGQLDRGPGPAVPRVVGTSIVEGDRVVAVDADEVQLLGVSGAEYVVAIYAGGGFLGGAGGGRRHPHGRAGPGALRRRAVRRRDAAGHHEAARDASYGRDGARRDHR